MLPSKDHCVLGVLQGDPGTEVLVSLSGELPSSDSDSDDRPDALVRADEHIAQSLRIHKPSMVEGQNTHATRQLGGAMRLCTRQRRSASCAGLGIPQNIEQSAKT